jgi:hypothetical protein
MMRLGNSKGSWVCSLSTKKDQYDIVKVYDKVVSF